MRRCNESRRGRRPDGRRPQFPPHRQAHRADALPVPAGDAPGRAGAGPVHGQRHHDGGGGAVDRGGQAQHERVVDVDVVRHERCVEQTLEVAKEIRELHAYGVGRIYSPEDGQRMGLQGMIGEMVMRCDVDLSSYAPKALEARLELIRQAQTSVDLQTFHLADDSVGQAVRAYTAGAPAIVDERRAGPALRAVLRHAGDGCGRAMIDARAGPSAGLFRDPGRGPTAAGRRPAGRP